MNYIIDPKLFYLSGICENIYTTLIILSIFGLLVFGILYAIALYEIYVDGEDECKPLLKKFLVGFIVSICMLIVASFIPNKETCYAMMVAKTATVENVEFTIESLKSLVDYIAEVCVK